MSFRIFILFLLICLPGFGAQVPEFTQHISRSFKVNSSMSVDISNKYGKIQIIPWDEDSVRFEIDLRIRAKDRTKLEKARQSIEFDFTPGQYYIIAQTRFGDTGGSDVIKDIVDIAGSYLSSSNSVTINYTVMVPAYLSLKIENRFGNIYFDDHNGALKLVLSYGNFKANRLNGRSDIKITSGDADINFIREGLVTLSYTNTHIREGSNLSVHSQSSVITIEKPASLKLNSRRDKIYLNELNNLSGETYFSAVNIRNLKNSLTLDSRYGRIIIDNIQTTFSGINITSELTDLSLSFEKPLACDFDLTHHQSVSFIYPRELARLNTKVIDPDAKIFSTTGSFGTGASDSKVVLKALRKSNVTISQR